MIQKMKNMRSIRRKELLNKKTKLYCSETTNGDFGYVLFENEEATRGFTVTCEFKMEGYRLEEPDEENGVILTVELAPGDKIIKKLVPAEIVKKGAAPKKMGGFNPMAGLTDMYDQMEKHFSFKSSVEENEEE